MDKHGRDRSQTQAEDSLDEAGAIAAGPGDRAAAWFWVGGHWLGSRLVILTAMLGIAPLLPPATSVIVMPHWQSLVQWDGGIYLQIATTGYEYRDDGQGYNVAFFPLFPLLIWFGVKLGLPAGLAGIVINNLLFLAGLWVIYDWTQERHGQAVARWTTAALAWCPWSLFGTVPYTEGTFLVLCALALRSFDRGQSLQAGMWGALASATRLPGLMLVPALVGASWWQKRDWRGYLGGLLAGVGVASYALFCWWRFGDGLAFLKVQKAWHPPDLAYGEGWVKALVQVFLGPLAWKAGRIVDPWYVVAVGAIALVAFGLWWFRGVLGASRSVYGFCGLGVVFWLLAGSPLLNLVMVFGGAILVWVMRRELAPVAGMYGFWSVLLILSTGRAGSTERYMFTVVPVAIAFGLLLARFPRWGVPVLCCWGLPLVSLSIRFVQQLWAG